MYFILYPNHKGPLRAAFSHAALHEDVALENHCSFLGLVPFPVTHTCPPGPPSCCVQKACVYTVESSSIVIIV